MSLPNPPPLPVVGRHQPTVQRPIETESARIFLREPTARMSYSAAPCARTAGRQAPQVKDGKPADKRGASARVLGRTWLLSRFAGRAAGQCGAGNVS